MSARFTEDDVGKTVVNANGEELGMVAAVENEAAHVEPDPGITDTIKAALGWGETDENVFTLQEESVAEVTDEEIHLRGDLSSESGGATARRDRDEEQTPSTGTTDTGMGVDVSEGDTGATGEPRDDLDSSGQRPEERGTDERGTGMEDDERLMGDDDDDLLGDDGDDDGMIGSDDSRRDERDGEMIGSGDSRRDDDDEMIGGEGSRRSGDDEGLIGDEDDDGLMDDDDDGLIGDDDEGLLGDDDDDARGRRDRDTDEDDDDII